MECKEATKSKCLKGKKKKSSVKEVHKMQKL